MSKVEGQGERGSDVVHGLEMGLGGRGIGWGWWGFRGEGSGWGPGGCVVIGFVEGLGIFFVCGLRWLLNGGLVRLLGKWEDRTVWVEQRTRMTGKSLIVVVDMAIEICGRQDALLIPKYKFWNGFRAPAANKQAEEQCIDHSTLGNELGNDITCRHSFRYANVKR